MAFGGNVLKIVPNPGNTFDIYLERALGGSHTDVWVGIDILFPTSLETFALDPANLGAPGVFILYAAGSSTDIELEINSSDTTNIRWSASYTDLSTDLAVPNTVYHIDVHATSTDMDWYVDGVHKHHAALPSLAAFDEILLGLQNVWSNSSDIVYYLDNFTVGTSQGDGSIFTEDFDSASFAAWTGGSDSPTSFFTFVDASDVPGAVPPPSMELLLCDIATDTTVLDLTNIFTSMTIKPRANRPLTIIVTVPADQVRGTWDDDKPKLAKGIRAIKYKRNGTLYGHVRIDLTEFDGDENQGTIQITGYDPMMQLIKRPVRDADGSFVNPSFASPISGAEILKAAVDNTISNSGGAGDQEGPLPIDTTSGTFDTTVPPAVDLAAELTDWPITIGDLITTLTQTGAVDVIMRPVDSSMGFDPGILAELSILNKAGADLTATVHFDYDTGDRNVSKLRRVDDLSQLCNKLIYELGPRIDDTHWQGNITATETTPVDLSAYLTLEEDSRDIYGTYMEVKVFDSADENDARPLFHELWKNEVALRINGRELVYMTPVAGCEFEPFDGYHVFDTTAINASDLCGREIVGETQRIYGFDVSMDGSDSVERVSELITSADAE
jgi:hypothetical protein